MYLIILSWRPIVFQQENIHHSDIKQTVYVVIAKENFDFKP